MFSFDGAPKGWLLCQGQTLQIAQFQALYALIKCVANLVVHGEAG